MFDRANWTPQNLAIGLGVLFVLVWSISGEFMAAVLVVALILLRVPPVRRGLWQWLQKRPKLHRYRDTSYDPFATTPDEDAELQRMPRYSEGRSAPSTDTSGLAPVRYYAPDDEEEGAAPYSGPTRSVQFSAAPPPKKPVQLPRHRP